ncbi:protein NDR1-like [Tasmannia lanceolata]|uniref:protein NDR1-like n=1 Tax=Tasmannia lanceolata TaxID=3420 RepID=UPI0040633380
MSESRRFYLWLVVVLLALGVVAFLCWVSVRPKSPTYTVVELYIPTGLNTTTISFDLEIYNPNKKAGIYFDNMNITLVYGNHTLDPATIESFFLGHHKIARRTESVTADRHFWRAVFRAVSNGTAYLNVGLATKVRYQILGRMTKHYGMEMQGEVPVGSDRKISGKRKKTKLHHAHKK